MSERKIEVIGVGSPILDVLSYVPDSFLETVSGDKGGMELVDAAFIDSVMATLPGEQFHAPGGAAANTILNLAKLGVSTTFLGMSGKDTNGEFYRTQFAEAGCDTSRFKIHDSIPNAVCLSLITSDAERTMRTHLGAASELLPELVSAKDFEGCWHLQIEGYLLFNRDLLNAVLASAKQAHCSISLDLGSFEVVKGSMDILPALLEEYVDIVFANEEEAAAYLGEDDPDKALDALASVCEVAVVKLGKKGCLIKRGNEKHVIEAVTAREVKDTTGAGDLWASGFLYGYIRDLPLDVCGKLGSIVGAETVAHTGANLPLEVTEKLKEKLEHIIEGEKLCQ